jgi:hypothetical protein
LHKVQEIYGEGDWHYREFIEGLTKYYILKKGYAAWS